MRIFLDQNGCRLNYSEMETLARQLQAAGHQTVDSVEQAQVAVFNSCAVTTEAERKTRHRVRQLHRANPDARIAVTGCWSTLAPDAAYALDGVALVADNEEKALLASLLEPWSTELDGPDDLLRMQPDGTPFAPDESDRRSRTRAFIKVQDGCNNRCTFCVVTLARGASRSLSIAEAVAEVQMQAECGVMEAVLTGVHLGSYGRDLAGAHATDLMHLVDAILRDTDIARLRLSSLEPWELAEGFFDLWARWPQRLCPHLHLPLQAGTDRQLRAMARRCTVDSYRRLADEARSAIPDLTITTDIIVGFPGETDADFEAGLTFIEEMRFAHAHVFSFSARPGTAAAALGSAVDAAVMKERRRRVQETAARTGRVERLRFVGAQRSVLWEGEGQLMGDGAQKSWTGLTDNYLRVETTLPANVDLANRVTMTSLDRLQDDRLIGAIRIPEAV